MSDETKSAHVPEPEEIATRDRIIACVNYFEGIDTRTIQSMPRAIENDTAAQLIQELEFAYAALRHIDESLEIWIRNSNTLSAILKVTINELAKS